MTSIEELAFRSGDMIRVTFNEHKYQGKTMAGWTEIRRGLSAIATTPPEIITGMINRNTIIYFDASVFQTETTGFEIGKHRPDTPARRIGDNPGFLVPRFMQNAYVDHNLALE